MTITLVRRITAAVVFFVALFVFVRTVQPSVSFWDPGEISAASYLLMVPHPPGGPFWLMLGRLFSMIPFGANIGFHINLVSVFAGAFSVLLLFLVGVKLIENYRGKEYPSPVEALQTYLAAAVGALALAFCGTYWFNATESNYFAMSTLLYSLIIWLMMLVNEKPFEDRSVKYCMVMGYLIGLSAGLHLMSVLAIFTFVAVVAMRRYMNDEEFFRKSLYLFLGHMGILALVAIGMWAAETTGTPPTPDAYHDYDTKFKLVFGAISVVVMAYFWKKVFNRNSFYVPVMAGGVALVVAYPGVVKVIPGLMAAIAGTNFNIALLTVVIIAGGLLIGVTQARKAHHPVLAQIFMTLLLMMAGFTTYTMIIIRANQNPPMNENEPKSFDELVTYLNREQYGDFPAFKRRFSNEDHQAGIYTNYSSDLDFLWKYQMNHMMTRYLLWNFGGRQSTDQDAPANVWPFNGVANVLGKVFALQFDGKPGNSLFGIPFILAVLGIYFHFKRDWKMATLFTILFLFMGYMTAYYQNQQQPQPRDRDYFYAGAYFVMGAWIAIAVHELMSAARRAVASPSQARLAAFGVAVLALGFVPVRMLQVNYFPYDRSRNWLPWDHSYNLLQSCAPSAILFTNGDNDTFPLWYLQAVEGIRRDVRIACLSLLNTPWYIRELKHEESYGTKKVPMRLTDQQINNILPVAFNPQDITLAVPPKVYQEFGVTDTAEINKGKITFHMNNTLTFGDVKAIRVQDIAVKAIIESNNWDRPIYFATTCGPDSRIGADDYLRLEGLAYRLVPVKKRPDVEYVDEPVVRKQLVERNEGFSKECLPGFKFRGLNDSTIFFDENEQRMAQNYRNSFTLLAYYYLNTNQKERCAEMLDLMEKTIPRSVVQMDYRAAFNLGNLYYYAGAMKQFNDIVSFVEPEALQDIEANPTNVTSPYNPYRILLQLYSLQKSYAKSVVVLTRLQALYPGDTGLANQIAEYRRLAAATETSAHKEPPPDSGKH